MTSVDFVKEVAAGTGMSQKDVRDMAVIFENAIKTRLASGESFKFADINFSVKDVPAHTGRNPATGETIELPATKKVVLKSSTTLKDCVK